MTICLIIFFTFSYGHYFDNLEVSNPIIADISNAKPANILFLGEGINKDIDTIILMGTQHLNGQQTMQLLRFRLPGKREPQLNNIYDGSDLKRIEVQKNVLKEILKQKVNVRYISKILDITQICKQNTETSLSKDDIFQLLKSISSLETDKVNLFNLPGNMQNKGSFHYVINQKKMRLLRKYFSTSQ